MDALPVERLVVRGRGIVLPLLARWYDIYSRRHGCGRICRLFQQFNIILHPILNYKRWFIIDLRWWQTPHHCQLWQGCSVLFISNFLARPTKVLCYLLHLPSSAETINAVRARTAQQPSQNKQGTMILARSEQSSNSRLRRHVRHKSATNDCGLRQSSLPNWWDQRSWNNTRKHKMACAVHYNYWGII